ncbi:hypothetical protein C8R42DRAFT_726115 [Lentinula raphanica]|nr:hypothetical protein C8R42DRAFT_726115 [Lentinula raphanica]
MLRIIRNSVKEALSLVQTQEVQALLTAESDRQVAETQVHVAQGIYRIREAEVNARLEEMNEQIRRLNLLTAQINKDNNNVEIAPTPISSGTPSPVASPPPSPTKTRTQMPSSPTKRLEVPISPTKSHAKVPSSPTKRPETPPSLTNGWPNILLPPPKLQPAPPASSTHQHSKKVKKPAVPASTSLAGTTMHGPAVPVSVVHKGSRHPAYVVYQGHNHSYGVYYAWTTINGVVDGADSICNPALHSHVVGSFNDVERAQTFYQEFVDTGIADLLQNESVTNENFIVCQGVKPGVYSNRKSLVIEGLQYRGGVVVRYIGSFGDALAQLETFRTEGKVKVSHPKRNHF